jgi:hypothetical protein
MVRIGAVQRFGVLALLLLVKIDAFWQQRQA